MFVNSLGYGDFEGAKMQVKGYLRTQKLPSLENGYVSQLLEVLEGLPRKIELAAFAKLIKQPVFLEIVLRLQVSGSIQFQHLELIDGCSWPTLPIVHREFAAKRSETGFEYFAASPFNPRSSHRAGIEKRRRPLALLSRRMKTEKIAQGELLLHAGPRGGFHIAYKRVTKWVNSLDRYFSQMVTGRRSNEVALDESGDSSSFFRIGRRNEVIADLINWRVQLDCIKPDGSPFPFPGFNPHSIKMMIVGRKH